MRQLRCCVLRGSETRLLILLFLHLGLELAPDKTTSMREKYLYVDCRGEGPTASLKTYEAVPRGHLEVLSQTLSWYRIMFRWYACADWDDDR